MKPNKLLLQDNNACYLFSFRVLLNRLHLMVPVVMVGVSVHREFQAFQEALDPRDHTAIMDLKDPWAHEETKAMKEPMEDRDLPAQAVTKVKQAPPAPRDPKDPQVRLVPMETRVRQVLVEVKVPQVPRVLQDRLFVIGNSAF